MFTWPRNRETPNTHTGSRAGSSSSPHCHRAGPSTRRFRLARAMGRVSANTSGCTQLQAVPPRYPCSTPKPGEGRGSLTVGRANTILRKADKKKSQALSPRNNATGCLE